MDAPSIILQHHKAAGYTQHFLSNFIKLYAAISVLLIEFVVCTLQMVLYELLNEGDENRLDI
jgi:hypothetical protein